jgi:hypothetical protein
VGHQCQAKQHLTKIIKNCDKMFVEKPKKIYYCYSIWQESYVKIKAIGIAGLVQIQFIQGLDVFSIIEPNSWLIIDDLAESRNLLLLQYLAGVIR